MKIIKVLNNNVIIAKAKKQGEIIVVGTGIGFMAKPSDMVNEKNIQKTFVISKNPRLEELIKQIPAIFLELTERIVENAKNQYDMNINENIYLSLTDHIYFSIKRIQDGIDIDNPFLLDIKHFYKKEYQAALFSKQIIKKHCI